MTRRVVRFLCEGATLLGTLDEGSGATGALIVSGGNEIRAGAHRGMAMLAARLAASGTPVFRYDRRGIGDSEGANGGYAGAAPDLAAAAATFRAEAGVTRIIGFGNCDAATLLALEGPALGIDPLVLANPWTGDEPDAFPPTAAIRATYAARLRDPAQWRRLLRGGVDLGKLAGGLAKLLLTRTTPPPLAERLVRAVERSRATVIAADGDATALAFADAARRLDARIELVRIATDSHGFARAGDLEAVENVIRTHLRGEEARTLPGRS
ncbi:hydrolase 1, exosortase A system-associated [Sphingomonas adhaesiva]|uniref:hydrolase 1, exosortase A system-associated n=1 Tax=Sphingomonas adhaesiva TaxID=28212 RepID=UPI002FF852DC